MEPVAALSLRGIVKSFSGVQALKGVDLDVRSGEIHALLGENGAGKSTLMKVLSGIHQPDAGEIRVGGEARRFKGYGEAVAAGVGTVFQEFSLVPFLDAVDNIFLGRERTRLGLCDRAAMRAEAAALFARLGVALDLAAPVSRLSVAQQQFVEIAKALALDARILVLDEPTATLTPGDTRHLFAILRTLKAQGVAVIFISHHMEEIFELCDRVTVLRDGARVGDAEVASTDTAALVRMMIGRPLDQTFPPRLQARTGPVLLQVDDLQIERDGPVNSFHVRAGEILGFAGLVGSGRTETALAVIGAAPTHRKTVAVEGRPARISSPADALRLGVGLLPENRKTEGLITGFSIRDNISVNNLSKYAAFGLFIRKMLETASTASIMKRLGVKAPDMHARVDTLSGGNQQKVVLARWLNHHARVLLFDEPTRGVDVGAKAEIYRLMREMSAQGLAVVMISSELPEIVGMCDRVAVFRQGRIVKLLEAAAITAEAVIGHATAAAPEPAHA